MSCGQQIRGQDRGYWFDRIGCRSRHCDRFRWRDALAEQVAVLTWERDTLTGKAAQRAADLAEAQRRIGREQQAAEAARVEVATARLKIEAQAECGSEQTVEI